MEKYSYDLVIAANSENEADTKAQALLTLASHLSDKELARLEKVVLEEPAKLALAKKALGL